VKECVEADIQRRTPPFPASSALSHTISSQFWSTQRLKLVENVIHLMQL
jgi:hypothetical protein